MGKVMVMVQGKRMVSVMEAGAEFLERLRPERSAMLVLLSNL